MHLHVTHDSEAGSTRRIARLGNVPGEKEVEIFFDMEGLTVGPPAVLDGFVFGVIFYAMRLGEDLRVGGPMTGRCHVAGGGSCGWAYHQGTPIVAGARLVKGRASKPRHDLAPG